MYLMSFPYLFRFPVAAFFKASRSTLRTIESGDNHWHEAAGIVVDVFIVVFYWNQIIPAKYFVAARSKNTHGEAP